MKSQVEIVTNNPKKNIYNIIQGYGFLIKFGQGYGFLIKIYIGV